jgi:3-isopropylmalate/(R)-2-methylmalate dehydratase large subunit
MGKTIAEKILSSASGEDAVSGDRVWAELDLAVVRDFGGPNVVLEFDEFTEKGRVWDSNRIAMTFDYQAPAKMEKVAQNQRICREFADRQGIGKLFDVDAGIGQHVLLERGHIAPGKVVVGTDSHMNLLGAVGSYSTGVGTTDMVASWYTGQLWFRVPETIRVILHGSYQDPVSAKDLTLFVLSALGTDLPNYRAIEFDGELARSLGLAERITLCSMITEMNGVIGFLPLTDGVLDLLSKRGSDISTSAVCEPDSDAVYVETIEIDADGLEPQIACPHTPDNVKKVRDVDRIRIDQGFIGSCTNGRIEDLRATARILERGGKVKARMIVTPATMEVARQALDEGLYRIFMDAGAMVTNPGCSLCTIGHHGVLAPGDVLVSTSNRNFLGKLGRGGGVYLASPETVAASCVTGEITDPRDVL